MHTRDVIERLGHANPARQDGNIGHETDIAHQLIAIIPGIAPKHFQFPLVRSKAENGIERGRLSRAIRPDESNNATLFDPEIHTVERNRCAKHFAQTARFYCRHGFSGPPSSAWKTAYPRQLP